MKNLRLLFILMNFCLLSQGLLADPKLPNVVDDGGWKEYKSRQGYTIFERKQKEAGILPIKVTGVINAPIDFIMEALRDVEGQVSWTPDLIEKTTLKDLGPKAAVTYSLTDMPWPIYDRRLILHNELFLDKERKLLFIISKTVSHPNPPVPKKSIEAFVGYSNMGFRPLDKNRTYVELTAFIDPKGSIPTWIINFYQQGWPIDFLKALEKKATVNPKPLRPGLRDMLSQLLKLMNFDQNMFDRLAQNKQ